MIKSRGHDPATSSSDGARSQDASFFKVGNLPRPSVIDADPELYTWWLSQEALRHTSLRHLALQSSACVFEAGRVYGGIHHHSLPHAWAISHVLPKALGNHTAMAEMLSLIANVPISRYCPPAQAPAVEISTRWFGVVVAINEHDFLAEFLDPEVGITTHQARIPMTRLSTEQMNQLEVGLSFELVTETHLDGAEPEVRQRIKFASAPTEQEIQDALRIIEDELDSDNWQRG